MSQFPATAWLAPLAAAACVGMVGALLAPRQKVRMVAHQRDGSAGLVSHQRIARRCRPLVNGVHLTLQRRRHRFDPTALGSWIDDLSAAVRRGTTLRQSLLDVRPDDHHLDERTEPLRHALDRGERVPEATRRWMEKLAGASSSRERRHLVATASVLGVAADVGGSVGHPLDRLAAAMRLSAADDMERAAQSAQARISARVLTLLPLAVLSFLVAIDPEVRSTIGSAPGLVIVSLGVTLNLVGAWWMNQIIDRTTR